MLTCQWRARSPSDRGPAAVDAEHDAGDERARVAGEEEERAVELVRFTAASHRSAAAQPPLRVLVAEHATLGHLGVEPAGRERVHAHTAPRPLRRELAGE